MTDITSTRLLWCKGILFVAIGVVASVLLLLESPSGKVGVLLALAVWAFCRAYYFAFYVVEHYADPGFRFSGLGAFLAYALRRAARKEKEAEARNFSGPPVAGTSEHREASSRIIYSPTPPASFSGGEETQA